jgi:hypothetical protein
VESSPLVRELFTRFRRQPINEFVSSEDGLRLAKAFMQIENAELRHRIVNLVQEIAGSDGD